MQPRHVDERDTVWESVTSDFRVFFADGQVVSAFDVDSVSFDETSSWAQQNAGPNVKISIALREINNAGQLGLRWLTGDPM